jgi:GNAT superfamily N-acetyltransferase
MPGMPTPKPIIRPARPDDREEAFAISAQIWDGEDYVPDVWERWLADRRGEFVVATLRGRVAGFSKLTEHGPREWWLEGLRVDPKYRGRGIARALHEYLIARAGSEGPAMLRYATGGDNLASRHLGESSGFRLVGAYSRVHAKALTPAEREASKALPPLETWRKADLPALQAFLERSARLKADHGMYSLAWTWYELSETRLGEALAARRAVGWRHANGAVVALALLEPQPERRLLRVNFADGRLRGPLGLADLGRALRDLARRKRLARVAYEVPTGSPWQAAFARAGFVPEWDEGWSLVLLERAVP